MPTWKIADRKKVGSLNDNAIRNLPAGRSVATIVGAENVINKQDPRGRESQVLIKLEIDGVVYREYIKVESTNDQVREIALKELVAFFDAAGTIGAIHPKLLPNLIGKTVVIDVVSKKGNGDNKDKTYSNINSVEAYEGDEKEEDEEEEEENTDDEEEEDEEEEEENTDDEEEEDEEEEDEEEEEEEEPAPARKKALTKKAPVKKAPAKSETPAKKKRPWG